MPGRTTPETCEFCGRHGPCIVLMLPYNTMAWRCAEGCPEAQHLASLLDVTQTDPESVTPRDDAKTGR